KASSTAGDAKVPRKLIRPSLSEGEGRRTLSVSTGLLWGCRLREGREESMKRVRRFVEHECICWGLAEGLPRAVRFPSPSKEGPMCRSLVLLFAVVSLAFAPLPFLKPRPAETDLQALQGEWQRVRVTINGSAYDESRAPTTIVIDGARMKY